MKRVLLLFIMVLISYSLLGFGEVAYSRAGAYDMGREYIDKLEQNPIDKDYRIDFSELNHSPRFSTQASVELEVKYANLWDIELNSIYKKLQSKLNENQKELLIDSQVGWLQFHTKEAQLVAKFPFGSQGRVQRVQAYKSRLRERTLELMEYYVRLGGSVEFEYKGYEKME
jgi:uncharacterized protein YecT (DUF1311 family)